MESLASIALSLAGFVFFILLGLIVGGANERQHFRNLAMREECHQLWRWTQSRKFINPGIDQRPPIIVMSEVAIGSDYLKTFLAKLHNFFGGEVKSFESLMERARREAILRLIEQAQVMGYNSLCNIRLESVDIGGNLGRKGVAMVSLVATATAYAAQPCEQNEATSTDGSK